MKRKNLVEKFSEFDFAEAASANRECRIGLARARLTIYETIIVDIVVQDRIRY